MTAKDQFTHISFLKTSISPVYLRRHLNNCYELFEANFVQPKIEITKDEDVCDDDEVCLEVTDDGEDTGYSLEIVEAFFRGVISVLEE